MIRYLAGGRYELDEAAPVDAGTCSAPAWSSPRRRARAALLGGEVLQSAWSTCTVPVLGDVHLVTSVFFDIGVYLSSSAWCSTSCAASAPGSTDRHPAASERDQSTTQGATA